MKEMYRADFEERRHEFETNNLGSYELLYPCRQENPERHEEYDKILAFANKQFDDVQEKKYNRKNVPKVTKTDTFSGANKPASGGWSWGAPKPTTG
jgi:hypothetical protein